MKILRGKMIPLFSCKYFEIRTLYIRGGFIAVLEDIRFENALTPNLEQACLARIRDASMVASIFAGSRSEPTRVPLQ